MARSKKSKDSIQEGTSAIATSTGGGLALHDAPDAFMIANDEIDDLYQRVKDGDPEAANQLRCLNTALRLKMTLANFKQSIETR